MGSLRSAHFRLRPADFPQSPCECCFRFLLLLLLFLLAGYSRCIRVAIEVEGSESNNNNNNNNLEESSMPAKQQTIHVKVGALLEESAHEQANMFIRTIKMINERKDETIRQLLNVNGQTASSSTPPQFTSRAFGQQLALGAGYLHQNISLQPQETLAASIPPQDTTDRQFTPDFWLSGAKQSIKGGHYNNIINNNASSFLLPKLPLDIRRPAELRVKLEPMIELLSDRLSSVEADCKACQLIESGVFAVLGPTEGSGIQHVQSICDNTEIPYFELRPYSGSSPSSSSSSSYSASVGSSSSSRPSTLTGPSALPAATTPAQQQNPAHLNPNRPEELSVNLFPPAQLLTSAYIELINALNWSSFAIVYEEPSSMIKLQDLFRESSGSWTSKWQIKLFQYNPNPTPLSNQASSTIEHSNHLTSSSNHPPSSSSSEGSRAKQRRASLNPEKRPTFRELFWQIRTLGEHNILLDVRTEHLYEALKNAQQVGCMTESYSYLVTSLDLHTIELEDFRYSRTRITGFSMLEVARDGVNHAQQRTEPPALLITERYLERLGFPPTSPPHSLAPAADPQPAKPPAGSVNTGSGSGVAEQTSAQNGKQGALFTAEEPAASDSPTRAAHWSRKESLQSSPASMSLLPAPDRDTQQRLFEFLIEQQERQISVRSRPSLASAVLHDSLLLFSLALRELDLPEGSLRGEARGQMGVAGAACGPNSPQPWLHGSSLVNYMRQISFRGLTGSVSFDQAGLRSDFKLNLIGMAPDLGLVKVGEWYSSAAARQSAQVLTGKLEMQHMKQGDVDTVTLEDEEDEESGDRTFTYEQQSEYYENQLRQLQQQLAAQITANDKNNFLQIPYTKQLKSATTAALIGKSSLNAAGASSLMVNKFIYEHLYRDHSDQVDTLIVATKLSNPYFMLKETPNKLVGNDQYEGFAVDLIHELSKLINFNYKWRKVADKKYGSKEILPNGTVYWNGMIGDLVRGLADLAIVDLTITAQREEAVDFTLPFMNTGISILFKKPTTKVTTLFSFLSPFSSDVWAYVLAAYCGISAVLYLVGHLSPYEWENPHPCGHIQASEDDDDYQASGPILKNQFSLLNSFWFTIGSLMQQGSDLTPRSMSTRTIAGIWYFFTLIMISSYTANLAAFLTVEKVVYPIENVRDLSNQQEIKYGCVESGSTCTFFLDSQIDTYKRINENMQRHKTYVKSNEDGQKRVEEGKFAFFMESTSIEYIIERECNLTQIGGLLDSKGYGIATSKRSRLKRPYRTLLSEGILHLQETGMLHTLKNRWWKERRGGGTCTDDGKGGGVTELSLANVGGVFVVLLGGLGVSFLVAIAEFMWRSKRSGSTRDSMCEEMMNDLKFALSCKRSMKPVLWRARQERRARQRSNQMIGQKNVTLLSTKRNKNNNNNHNRPSKQQQQQQLQLWSSEQSTVAVSSQEQPATSAAFTPQQSQQNLKDCNPVLLHAMLTMLYEQQQQQQNNNNNNNNDNSKQANEFVGPANLAKQLQYANHSMRLQPENREQHLLTSSSVEDKNKFGLSAGLMASVSGDSENLLASLQQQQQQQQSGYTQRSRLDGLSWPSSSEGFAQSLEFASASSICGAQLERQPQKQPQPQQVKGAAGKRRLLFAQQTIDTDNAYG